MTENGTAKARHRSPGYPSIDLDYALSLAQKFFDHAKRTTVSVENAAAYWGFSATSSGWRLAMSALKQFGLIDAVGGKKSGEVKLSDLALKIMLDTRESSRERDDAIKQAALNPEIYKELWLHWSGKIPDDATFETYLTYNKAFNANSVSGFISDFKKTIAFAKLSEADIIRGAGAVTRESAPKDQSDEQDDGEERRLRRKPVKAGMQEDVFTLEEGQVVLQYPESLSPESFDDLESWLQLIVRKAKRSVRDPKEPDEE